MTGHMAEVASLKLVLTCAVDGGTWSPIKAGQFGQLKKITLVCYPPPPVSSGYDYGYVRTEAIAFCD